MKNSIREEIINHPAKKLFDIVIDIESYPDVVQRVLINMCFNMGAPRLGKFQNMKKAVEAGDWKQAAVEGRDSRWHKQVPNRAERLMVALEEV